MKNANLKKRVLATMVSATVAFGGVAVAAPSADADPRITSQYSALDNIDQQAALDYNATQTVNREMNMMATNLGPGWCIDAHLDVPYDNTLFDVRKLDGTSGFYGFNGNYGGDLRIHPDIQRAAISLTKSMLTDYYKGNAAEVEKKNFALQALLSNNLEMLDKMRGLIRGNVKAAPVGPDSKLPPEISEQEFLEWTGFEIGYNYGKPLGQSAFFLSKNEEYFSQLNVKSGEYVTVLVPKNYNVYEDLNFERTNQRIVIVAQPGLDGFEPQIKVDRVTKTVTPDPVTVTETRPGQTVTETVKVTPTRWAEAEYRPTVTKTEHVQPVKTVTETATQPDTTVTAWEQPEMTGVTETFTREVEPTTVTETAPQETVTEYAETPVTVTKTETVTPTVTQDGATETSKVTQTAEPVYVTETVTQPEKTETKTVTAAPKTVVSTVHTTVTNRKEIERTTEVERYFRDYKYAFDFGNSEKSREVEVKGLGDWKIDFIDDSNGLVKVEKKIVDGKAVLDITPIREGRGTVRIVVVDAEGNRNEYTINVVNEKTDKIVQNEVVQNNHYFNVGTSTLEQTIPVPQGWEYEIVEGGNYLTTNPVNGGFTVKVNEGVLRGTAKIKVYEVGEDGKPTGYENNYTFNIDAMQDQFNQFRTIGNQNPYTLEIENIEGEPKITAGEDVVESLEKNKDGFWVLTPKSDAQGTVVITAKDKDGQNYTVNLTVKQGTNVQIDATTFFLIDQDEAEITADSEDWELERVSGNPDNWTVTRDGKVWKIKANAPGTATFNLYAPGPNGERILKGQYVAVNKTQPTEKLDPAKLDYELSDRGTATLTPGSWNSARNLAVITKGEENATLTEKDGKYVIEPKVGFEGEIEVTEYLQDPKTGETLKDADGEDVVVAIHTLKVTPKPIAERDFDITSDQEVNLGADDSLNWVIVEGEDLLDANASDLSTGKFVAKPNAEGTIVLEARNARDLPVSKVTINVKPAEVREETIELNANSRAGLTLPEGFTYKIVGDEIVDIERNGRELNVTPKEGKTGTTVLEVSDERGNVVYRYKLVVDGTDNNSGSKTINNSFKITEDGSFKITRVNDNDIKIVSGNDSAEIVKNTKDEWILEPKEGSAGNQVIVVETRGDVIVKRHVIDIAPEPTPLRYKEERRLVVEKIDGFITKGKPTNEFRVLRGHDLIDEPKLENGDLQIIPREGKTGTVLVEEVDSEGNPVRVVELEIPKNPEYAEGNTPPSIDYTGNKKDGWNVTVTGGSNSADIKLCESIDSNGKCVNPTRMDDKYVVPGNPTEEGSQFHIKPGDYLNKYKYIVLRGSENGMGSDVEVVIDLEAGAKLDNQQTDKGSSELDGKCIASIVGLSAPLLLAIPLGILSQVQIPGLEGLSAQVNDAIREANDQIQRGLGIYDNERAQRAASFQGALSVENQEMLGLAAGSLAAITLGLLIVDGVLRACGQEEMTSSYKLGEATDSEFLKYGSSGKTATEGAKAEDSESAGSSNEGSSSEK